MHPVIYDVLFALLINPSFNSHFTPLTTAARVFSLTSPTLNVLLRSTIYVSSLFATVLHLLIITLGTLASWFFAVVGGLAAAASMCVAVGLAVEVCWGWVQALLSFVKVGVGSVGKWERTVKGGRREEGSPQRTDSVLYVDAKMLPRGFMCATVEDCNE